MSDLGGGRATNGGARTGGPVPVAPTGTPTGMRTPRDIMRARNAREARRQEEQKAEEQRRVAEDRRRSAERRAATVGGAAPRFSQSSSQYTPDISAQQAPFERSGSGRVAGSNVLGDPTGRSTGQDYPTGRARGSSVSQPEQPRPATARRTQATQSAPRQPTSSGATAGAQPQQAQGDGAGQRGTASSFPHAFDRWETLSSHWEGLTSYWLHKLEQNTEEIRETVPNAVTLNRQITDLSAAGANLFHAVVELQRLRASSERKFQRWFFETRADNERNREIQAQSENQIKAERSGRDEAAKQRAEAFIQAENARREVAESRRELMISKEEARRAWEELGRRNQESLETAQALKEGRIALVGGVQVVPYFGGPSRTESSNQRPVTRDGQLQYSSTGMASAAGAAGLQSPDDEQEYYQQEASPTNTDPFMDSGAQVQPLHHEPGTQSLAAGTYQPHQIGATPTSTSTAQTIIPMTGQRPGPSRAPAGTDLPMTTEDAQRFYKHAPHETFLHSPQSSSQAIAGVAEPGQAAPVNREEIRSEASYVDTLSEGDTEYAIDSGGNIRHDDQGRPIVFRRRVQSNDTDDSYDTEADIRREQEHAARYGSSLLPEAPAAPGTSAQAMANYTPTTSAGPDYEGSGYGQWDTLQTRHHHPTRLSDVLEEEEERSSRRTGD